MDQSPPRVFAIVPAAGWSRRMGADKQLIDVGGRQMAAAVVEPLAASRVEGVALVTRAVIAEQLALPPHSTVFAVLNDNPGSEMIDSVRLGMDTWCQRAAIRDHDGFLICPGDQPGIATADFDACIDAFRLAPDHIIIASRSGRRGHPIIFPARFTPYVSSSACDRGLNALPHAHADRVRLVERRAHGVTHDVDTPTDLADLT